MDLDKPAVLLVGGGEGMGPVEKTVDGLVSALGAECQLVVICGRNAKLVQRLTSK
jgi:1,2-diacylglycerol 3-beta-galactosyltransferase